VDIVGEKPEDQRCRQIQKRRMKVMRRKRARGKTFTSRIEIARVYNVVDRKKKGKKKNRVWTVQIAPEGHRANMDLVLDTQQQLESAVCGLSELGMYGHIPS
jgi:hypothetical protein